MKRMKIVHVCLSGSWSGSEVIAAELANGLAEKHQIGIVFADSEKLPREFYTERLHKNLRFATVPQNPSKEQVENAVQSLFAGVPDILHGHLGPACRMITRICPTSIKLGHLHMRYFDAQHAKLNGVVAIAPWQIQDLPPTYKGHRALVPNFGQAWRTPEMGKPARNLRNMLSLGPDEHVIGSVGRLHIDKGIDILIESMRLLNEPKVHLLLFGGGPQETILRELARGLPNVHFMGFRHDVNKLVRDLDLYISASRAESFGLAALEAMEAGVSVVASRTYGSSWLLEHLPERLFAIEDVSETTKVIREFLARPNESPDYKMKRFDRDRSLRSMERVYADILTDRKSNSSFIQRQR